MVKYGLTPVDPAGTFDYIVVGAGASGCAIARRLSENPAIRVLLLEAGPKADSPFVTMPKAMARLMADQRRTWRYDVDSTPNRPETWVRGRLLGGSSSINGMIYSRGFPRDYEDWAAAGNPSWGAGDMLRCFREIENHELGDDGVRGAGGPVAVTVSYPRHKTTEMLIEAAVQAGLPRTKDLNQGQDAGVGYLPHTVKNGRRVSSWTAFIEPVRSRKNLEVRHGVCVDRVLFEGRRARGVLARMGSTALRLACRGEIILSANTLNSPKILQLSGVGPVGVLARCGIPIIHNSPEVGANLREHLGLTLAFRLKSLASHNQELRGWRLWRNVLAYYATRGGVMSYGPFEAGGYFKTRPDLDCADAVFALAPFSFGALNGTPANMGPEARPGFSLSGYVARPESQGTVSITSNQPEAPLLIKPNWLQAEYDRTTIVAIVKALRRIPEQPVLRPHVACETTPGASGAQSDGEILDAVRRTFTPGAHAVGTCAMGPHPTDVVDDRLRVRGVDGLRIADLSVAPSLVSGGTNGAAMALGWRAAELIKDTAGSGQRVAA